MENNNALIYLTITGVLLLAAPIVFGSLTQNTLNTTGIMADLNIGTYSNIECTNNLTSINWEICYINENKTFTVYIKNLGTVDATLSTQTDNWNPSDTKDHFILYSNCEGEVLSPNEVFEAKLSLYPLESANQFDTFNFDIIILSQD